MALQKNTKKLPEAIKYSLENKTKLQKQTTKLHKSRNWKTPQPGTFRESASDIKSFHFAFACFLNSIRSTFFFCIGNRKKFISLNVLCTFCGKCAMIHSTANGNLWSREMFAFFLQRGEPNSLHFRRENVSFEKFHWDSGLDVCFSFDYNLWQTPWMLVEVGVVAVKGSTLGLQTLLNFF